MTEKLSDYLDYDPISGNIIWKKSPSNVIKIGSLAGSINSDGYRQIKFAGEVYQASHIAWFLTHQIWPVELDHRDKNPSNDALHNLREATHSQNCCNRKMRSDNQTGFKGVSKRGNKYRARIWDGMKNLNLGDFNTPEEAHETYKQKAKILQGDYAYV